MKYNFRKYPAYLSVTVGSYQPETTRSVSLTRPMSVLEEETTGDIYTCGSDGDDLIDEQSQAIPMSSNERAPTQGHRGSIFNRSETKTLNLESRLPGQVSSFSRFECTLKSAVTISLLQFCICSNANVPIDWLTDMKYRIIGVLRVRLVHSMVQWLPNLI